MKQPNRKDIVVLIDDRDGRGNIAVTKNTPLGTPYVTYEVWYEIDGPTGLEWVGGDLHTCLTRAMEAVTQILKGNVEARFYD